jgi:hypothetical protein
MENKILERVLTINILLYLLGVFISGSANPFDWWMMQSPFGRLLIIGVEYLLIVKYPDIIKLLKR